MLKFRNINYEEDVNVIIELLNANFQTNHTKKNFLWKHFYNPFGKSYGLLAVDGDKIVALRMFMRWEFLHNGKVIKAIRPVDTCTDHAYRGQGLFKKLTLEGLDNIKGENDLVFNTPNLNSKPGYIKMGWKEIDQTFQYKIGFINILKKTEDFKLIDSKGIEFTESWIPDSICQTHISKEYLAWRFEDSHYKIATSSNGEVVVYKITYLKKLKTLILIDFFGASSKVNTLINSICKKNSIKLVYYLSNEKNKDLNFLFKYSRGVQTVVFRNDNKGISDKINFSVGDLEGRI